MINSTLINIKLIIRILGLLLILEGFFMLACLPFSYYFDENDSWALIASGVFTSFVGTILWIFTRGVDKKQIGKREGYIIVTFAWIIISVFGALPFVISKTIPNYTDAFFETISGFTTTGATILTDVEAMPKGLLFWRSMTHWIGGMGIIVLSLAILPILGIGGMQLFVAEVPGPAPDKLHPRITQTAKRLWGIYVLLTGLETILLMFGGMSLFDALCHAFGTMATGGFSTQNNSIIDYSPYIQYIIIIFMIIAGTNFTLHFFVLRGYFKKVWNNEEYRFYIYTLLIVSTVITTALLVSHHTGFEKDFRDALFQTVSIITTTGYVTADYLSWPFFVWLLIFMLMFTGGSAGSTGGGVKMVRQLLLLKNSRLELKRLLHPQAVIPVRLNGKTIPQNVIFNVLAFFLIYTLIFAFGSLFMSMLGLDFETSIGSVAATLGNIGPGIGSVGPVSNYSEIPITGKWFLSFLMLLGRLELFTVLVLFSRVFWKK
ncbi:MAG: TrkH family potassium uptake protein [Bacteroidales bacterium]|nr:TrkH family potassium uptake protein [Bacteroidales bacterium]